MKILICIATYKRIKKLIRLIKSLNKSTYKDFQVVIVADNNDEETLSHKIDIEENGIKLLVQPEHRFVIGAWNRAIKEVFIPEDYDAFLGLCDDVELYPDTLQKAVDEMKVCFGNTSGVIGLKQECPGHPAYTFKYFGQTLMGRQFIELYKDVDYQVCCPYYQFLYQDEEMYLFSKSINSFVESNTAILKHYHPAFCKDEMDETHNITRKGALAPKQNDIKLWNQRQREGKIWGQTWEK